MKNKRHNDLFQRPIPIFNGSVVIYSIYSRPLKSPFLRDIVQTQYLAYFLKHTPKSFHGSLEKINQERHYGMIFSVTQISMALIRWKEKLMLSILNMTMEELYT